MRAPHINGIVAVNRARFGKWFRRYPVVPMFGDMFTNLQHILTRCPNWASVNPEEFFATSPSTSSRIGRAQLTTSHTMGS